MRSGIQPCEAACETFDPQLLLRQIQAVDVGDFQFAARRRYETRGHINNLIVVEVQTGDRESRFWPPGLFFERSGRSVARQLYDAVPPRVFDGISKDRGTDAPAGGAV